MKFEVNLRRNRTSALRMSIHFRHNDCPKVSTFLKGLTLSLCSLPNARIQHEYRHIRLHCLTDLDHLLEELALLFMSSTRIDNDDFEPFFLKLLDTLSSDSDRVSFGI